MNPTTRIENGIEFTLCEKRLPYGGHCGDVWVDVATLIKCDAGCYTDDKYHEYWPLYQVN